MADGQQDDGGFDLSQIVPETYKGEDGAYDTAKFRADYDAAVSFKAQEDDRRAMLPKEPAELVFALPEDHQWPEGFDPAKMVTKDEAGNDVAFDPANLIDPEDPDIPALQAALHAAGVDKGVMSKVASIVVNREVRQLMQGMAEAHSQKQALGPQADARIATVTRTLESKMPKEQASALLNSITTADALRGFEQLLKGTTPVTAPAPGARDMASMSIDERIMLGLQTRKSA